MHTFVQFEERVKALPQKVERELAAHENPKEKADIEGEDEKICHEPADVED